MEPCVAEPCPSYPTPADFVVAIEVPQGGLADLGIAAGSVLELLAEGCPTAVLSRACEACRDTPLSCSSV